VEQAIIQHDGDLVAVVVSEGVDECLEFVRAIVFEGADRHNIVCVEVSRLELAQALGAHKPTDAAICSTLVRQYPALASDFKRKGVLSFGGPRSELMRYWTMPVRAFGAAVASFKFITQTIQNSNIK
jgi:hypothetical protein